MRVEHGAHLLLALITLLIPASLAARTGDSEQAITIDAGSVEVNHLTGIGVYDGGVVVRQGTLEIRAERAEIHVVDGAPDSVIIDGDPATFRQEEDDGSLSQGRADHMEYFSNQGRIRLIGNAWVSMGGTELEGEVVDYNLEDQVARLSGDSGADEPQRVRVVIEPRSSDPDGDG